MRLLLASLSLFFASAAMAETIRVRAGEHSGFTRLVFDGAAALDWRIGRTDTGYGLVIDEAGVTFDADGTDRDLRAGRVTAVRPDDSVLYIDLDCDCRAESFTLSGNRLVIDIRNGAPRGDAPTEHPLALTTATANDDSASAQPDDVAAEPGDPVTTSQPPVTGLPDFIAAAIEGTSASSSTQGTSPKDPGIAVIGGHSEFENMLVETLSRAASEGFVTGSPAGIESGSTTVAASGDASVGEVTGATGKTAYDLALDRGADTVASDACSATHSVDFLADPTAFEAVEIGPLIRDAYSEDGTLNPEDAIALARYMMAGGYGAEAAQLIDLAGDPSEATTFLHMAALAIDGRSAGADVDLARYAGCAGTGGLWTLLAGADETHLQAVDLPKAIAALSAYTPRIRRILGPLLVTQLLTHGRPEEARLAARAIPPRLSDDASVQGVASLSEVLLEDGRSPESLTALDAIIRAGGPQTHDAVLLQSLEKSQAEAAPTDAEIETLRALQADADPGGQAGALYLAELQRLLDGSEYVTVIERSLADHPPTDPAAVLRLEQAAWSGLVAIGSNFDLAFALRKWPGRIEAAELEPGLAERLAARIAEIGGDIALAEPVPDPAAENAAAQPEPASVSPADASVDVLREPQTVSDIRSLIGSVDAERADLEALLADAPATGAPAGE